MISASLDIRLVVQQDDPSGGSLRGRAGWWQTGELDGRESNRENRRKRSSTTAPLFYKIVLKSKRTRPQLGAGLAVRTPVPLACALHKGKRVKLEKGRRVQG